MVGQYKIGLDNRIVLDSKGYDWITKVRTGLDIVLDNKGVDSIE